MYKDDINNGNINIIIIIMLIIKVIYQAYYPCKGWLQHTDTCTDIDYKNETGLLRLIMHPWMWSSRTEVALSWQQYHQNFSVSAVHVLGPW